MRANTSSTFGTSTLTDPLSTQFGTLLPLPLLKHYFNVSNSYVLHKLRLVLFPWRHKPWSRAHAASTAGAAGAYGGASPYDAPASKGDGYAPPREDVNSPDLYIPGMSVLLRAHTGRFSGSRTSTRSQSWRSSRTCY